MSTSRISGFYKLDVRQRVEELQRLGWISTADAEALLDGRHVLSAPKADGIVENVIGVFGLPFAVAPNFRINGRDYLVPMVVEEPSVVAALSKAAMLARDAGGFEASCERSLLVGQVHVSGASRQAISALADATDDLLSLANAVHPRLVARGGGVRDIEVRPLEMPDGSPLIAVHLLVDTCDAMGANLVNTICEAIAPEVAKITGGTVALRILSNLCDAAVVTATVRFTTSALAGDGVEGAGVRDGIIRANDIAKVDPYRAATHNKGIMNGIDPLAVATGNDWRAIEAGAHAYAARSGSYRPLTEWSAADDGSLVGVISVPLKVGTVGGTLAANPAASIALALTGVTSAIELACLMAAAGLAQNLAALRALVTSGIQHGHMRMHARSIASSLGVPDTISGELVDRLVASGEIKRWKAEEILASLADVSLDSSAPWGRAAGKVILLGEHAAVYGKHALAVPLTDAVSASVEQTASGLFLSVGQWGIRNSIDPQRTHGVDGLLNTILKALELPDAGFSIRVETLLPRGMGLGSSAAIAVAVVRAFDAALGLGLGNERVNDIAFECERLAHGTPSGVDNTLATYGRPMLFQNDAALSFEEVTLMEPPPLVVAWGSEPGSTAEQVAGVRARRALETGRFDALFEQIDEISVSGADALQQADYERLGRLMNICHGILNAIGVSTPELERMVAVARQSGAAGAKLTGAGGGGSIVALCPGRVDEVAAALRSAGFNPLQLHHAEDGQFNE